MGQDSENNGLVSAGTRELWSRRRVLVTGALGLAGMWSLSRFLPSASARQGAVRPAADGAGPNLFLNPSFQDGPVGPSAPSWTIA